MKRNRPKSATRLHGKRTEIIHKPTTKKAPLQGRTGYISAALYLSEIWLCEQSRTVFCFARKKLNEVAPLTAAAEAFRQASGKKPDKKQIPALIAENARLEKELKYSRKDQRGLFAELQKSEKEKAFLKKDADTLRTLKTHAPDKLQEAMDTAKRRQESKHAPFRSNSSSWTK